MFLLLADLGTMIPLFCQLQSVLVNVWFWCTNNILPCMWPQTLQMQIF